LNRPGVNKKIDGIISNKKNIKNVIFFNESIKKILNSTYGYIIFEEQISQILSLVYNCSFAEAEQKRIEIENNNSFDEEFLNQAQKKFTIIESKKLHFQIKSSLKYTFNKAHAIAYSFLTYYFAYLKSNYFVELIEYFLNNKKEKTLFYLREAFLYDFCITRPDINHSQKN